MSGSLHLAAAGALCACLGFATAALARDADQYKLIYTLKLEDGRTVEMPFNFITGYSNCYQAKRKVEIGKVIPRGTLVSADGKSPSATVVDVKCVLL